jgi:hypothetical protein
VVGSRGWGFLIGADLVGMSEIPPDASPNLLGMYGPTFIQIIFNASFVSINNMINTLMVRIFSSIHAFLVKAPNYLILLKEVKKES